VRDVGPAKRRNGSFSTEATAPGKRVDVGCWPDSSGPFHRRRFVGQCQLRTSAALAAIIGFSDYSGVGTRSLQAYLGHRNIQHTVRYTELVPTRFKTFLAQLIGPARLVSSQRA